MDMKTKLSRVEQEIKMVSRADDVDSMLRNAALDKIVAFVEAERVAMVQRIERKMKAGE